MKRLNISPDLSLPLDAVTSTVVVYGGKGMGKTNLGAVLVEELSAAGLRWCALDPLGVWWGLRHSKDGSGPGIECVILGGVHGDIPIEPTGGGVAADLVVDETANVIIDFSRKPSGEMWGIGERVRFVTEYVKRLYQRQGGLADGKRREPIFQLLDEAARFIPQIIPAGNPDLAKCVSAWETLVEEGRNVGIGVGLLTQRSARMNKSVSEVADAMISFRIVGPNSIGAVMDWLGEHVPKDKIKQHIETLRSLERGRALIVSPGWLHFEGIANIRARETFDSSATPKPGERAQRVTGKAAKPDLEKYQARMRDTIERAKENNPAELKKLLAQARSDLAKRPTESAPSENVGVREIKKRVTVLSHGLEAAMKFIAEITARGFEGTAVKPEEIRAAMEKAVGEISRLAEANMSKRSREFESLKAKAESLLERLSALVNSDETVSLKLDVTHQESFTVRPSSPRPVPQMKPRSNGNGNGAAIPAGEKSVLIAIAQFGEGVDRDQLSVLTGYKRSTRDAYIQRLKERGYLSTNGGGIQATQEGIDALGSDYEPLPTGDALRDHWFGRLPEGERRILEVLVGAYPKSVERTILEESTGFKRSTRDAYIQRLTSRKLVLNAGSGEVKASDTLFG